jgi:hypothetical protein
MFMIGRIFGRNLVGPMVLRCAEGNRVEEFRFRVVSRRSEIRDEFIEELTVLFRPPQTFHILKDEPIRLLGED